MDLKVLAITDREQFIELRRIAQKHARSFPKELTPIPPESWPRKTSRTECIGAWNSRDFLVQLYREGEHIRITVSRTSIRPDGNWVDGITWDELMKIKADIGYRDRFAVEVYPAADRVVNVANMRHLWLVDEPAFAWKPA